VVHTIVMDKHTLFFLIDKYLNGTATDQEKALLGEYYDRLEKTGVSDLSPEEKIKVKEEMYRNIQREISGPKVVPFNKPSILKRVAVAASILLVLSTGAYFIFFNKEEQQIARTEGIKDIQAPTGTKATITLANGQTVSLDSVSNGTLAVQGDVKVNKNANGEIVYNGPSSGSGPNEVVYNTLSNPKGSQVVNITLADGSKVWLNTGSSLTYPVAFVGNDRKVSISGEAYFEVAHDPTKPFTVANGEMSVQVLGTHFNINAYDDENNIKVTLLEGSVKVNNDVTIKPGQQAQISNTGIDVRAVDVTGAIAWQRGILELNNTELPAIMRQISRWYDLDIVYEGKPRNEKFGGGISKNVPLSSMLKLLEANGVKFTLEGKTLKVR